MRLDVVLDLDEHPKMYVLVLPLFLASWLTLSISLLYLPDISQDKAHSSLRYSPRRDTVLYTNLRLESCSAGYETRLSENVSRRTCPRVIGENVKPVVHGASLWETQARPCAHNRFGIGAWSL